MSEGNGSTPALHGAARENMPAARKLFLNGIRLRNIVMEHQRLYAELFDVAHVLYYALTMHGQNSITKPPERPVADARLEDRTRLLAMLGDWFQKTAREHGHAVAAQTELVDTLEQALGIESVPGAQKPDEDRRVRALPLSGVLRVPTR